MFEKFNDIIDAENLNEQQILDLYSDIIEMGDGNDVIAGYSQPWMTFNLTNLYYTYVSSNCTGNPIIYGIGVRWRWYWTCGTGGQTLQYDVPTTPYVFYWSTSGYSYTFYYTTSGYTGSCSVSRNARTSESTFYAAACK